MKIFSLAPKENWILDRIILEWNDEHPNLFTDNVLEADIIWIIGPWMWSRVPRRLLEAKKVVLTVHHLVKEKFTKDLLREFLTRDKFVDLYHVPCQKTKDFISRITKKPIKVIGYWYNSSTWYPMNKNDARSSLEIPQDSYVIGSFQRDTEGSDLVSPKLEKGPDLFVEAVKKINKDNMLVLLGGWRRQYIINRLTQENIKYKFIKMAPLEQLREMYAACDLYVVSSRCEGGPQAILESAAMKIPIISRDVGMASAVLPSSCIMDIPKKIKIPRDKDVEMCYNNVMEFEIKNQSMKYIEMFQNLLGEIK